MKALMLGWLCAILFCSCAGLYPVIGHVEVRSTGDMGAAGHSQLPYLCREGACTVAHEVWLDERDLRGATYQDLGESSAAVVLQLNTAGATKLAVVLQSNQGRRLAIVHDAKVLGTWLADQATGRRTIELQGGAEEMRKIYEQLTRQAP